MNDFVKFCEAKSDQMNNVDLIGANRIIKITKVKVTATGKQDCTIWFEGDNGKPWKPCKTMGRILMEAWGENIQNFVGKSVELFRDPDATFGLNIVGGIRIRALSDVKEDFTTSVVVSRGQTKPVRIKKLITADSAIILAGTESAGQGIAAYTAWLAGLTPEVKDTIKHMHKGWSDIAKGVK